MDLYIAIVKTENALIDKFQEGSILEQNDLAQDKGQINLILFSQMFLKELPIVQQKDAEARHKLATTNQTETPQDLRTLFRIRTMQ